MWLQLWGQVRNENIWAIDIRTWDLIGSSVKRSLKKSCMVVHSINISTWKTGALTSVSWRPVWSIWWIEGHWGYLVTCCLKRQQKEFIREFKNRMWFLQCKLFRFYISISIHVHLALFCLFWIFFFCDLVSQFHYVAQSDLNHWNLFCLSPECWYYKDTT